MLSLWHPQGYSLPVAKIGEYMPKDFHGVMKEFKEGALHSGSKQGPKVTDPKQAKAIAYSEDKKLRGKKGK